MIIRFKEGVRLNFTSPPIIALLTHLVDVGERFSNQINGDLTITSGNDSAHKPNSRHYTDEAIDIRSKNFLTEKAKREFRAALEESLGPKFRVLYENRGTPNEHFHAQVKMGEKFV